MKRIPHILTILALVGLCGGCHDKKPYGVERKLRLPDETHQAWAVAPAINLSGQKPVDPLLQADLLYGQLQQVKGLTVIPVNRVVEVYAAMNINRIKSPQQAADICHLLGCDGLLIPTITYYDPYDPPKIGVSLDLILKAGKDDTNGPKSLQVVGMFNAANGATRQALMDYAQGRNDPNSPLNFKEYLVNIDLYNGFVYHQLIDDLIISISD